MTREEFVTEIEAWRDKLVNYARRRVQDEAEDVVQEVLAQVLMNLDKHYNDGVHGTEFYSYLKEAVRLKTLMHWRSEQDRLRNYQEWSVINRDLDEGPDYEDPYRDLESAASSLSERERETLDQELGGEDTHLDRSARNVRWGLKRKLRAKLAEYLEKK